MIEYVSHEYFPDDQYTKEICYMQIDPKFRFAYVRKMKKDGGLFWAPVSSSVTINGEKKFRTAIEWDSNFIAKDIIAFLEARRWESPKIAMTGNAFTDNYKPSNPTQADFFNIGDPPF
jgi:hypothetical protein